MMYFTLILQLICFVIWIALYFIKSNALLLIAAAIMPFSALSTYFYYKKKTKELSIKDSDEQGK